MSTLHHIADSFGSWYLGPLLTDTVDNDAGVAGGGQAFSDVDGEGIFLHARVGKGKCWATTSPGKDPSPSGSNTKMSMGLP